MCLCDSIQPPGGVGGGAERVEARERMTERRERAGMRRVRERTRESGNEREIETEEEREREGGLRDLPPPLRGGGGVETCQCP